MMTAGMRASRVEWSQILSVERRVNGYTGSPQLFCQVTGIANGPEQSSTLPKRAPYRSGQAGTVHDLGASLLMGAVGYPPTSDRVTVGDREVLGERAPSRRYERQLVHRRGGAGWDRTRCFDEERCWVPWPVGVRR